MYKKSLMLMIVFFLFGQILFGEVNRDVFSLSDIGWTVELKKLIENDSFLVNETDVIGRTPLHYAA